MVLHNLSWKNFTVLEETTPMSSLSCWNEVLQVNGKQEYNVNWLNTAVLCVRVRET